MSYSTPPETINAARKRHRCDWCNQIIESGESYVRWRWYDGGDAGVGKAHPECTDVMQRPENVEEEICPGANPRGCDCGFDPGCKCGWEAREAQS